MQFRNKKVIVTGANRSIGREIALAFASRGAAVAISYRSDKQGADQTLKLINKTSGAKAYAFQADFLKMDHVEAFASNAIKALNGVDILINNAGMLSRENFFECSTQKLQDVYQVNAMAPLYLSQLCVQHMLEHEIRGCIINISSIAGSTTMEKGIAYASSKAAMNKWTQNGALNLAQHGIRLNTVSPGVIHSGMNESTAVTDPQLWQQYLEKIPLKRTGKPADIANIVRFLASDEAQWITGKIIEVDGGHVLG